MQSLEPLSYFFGAMLGDGYFSRTDLGQYKVTIGCSDLEIVEKCYYNVTGYFSDLRLGSRYTYRSKSGKLIYNVGWYSKEFYELMIDAVGEKERFPYYIWEASREAKLDLLAGLMDTDGSIREIQPQVVFTGGKEFVHQFSAFCGSLGIVVSKPVLSKVNPPCWKFTLYKQSVFDSGFRFYCSRKQQILNRWKE